MKSWLLAVLSLGSSTVALPPYFLLAGDSTTATQSSNGGGWGDGFLNKTLKSGASGHNYGHNGATTKSFRSGGDWNTVISQVNTKKSSYNVFVTIQFGHNDQKNTSGVSETQFKTNLIAFANEVKKSGGSPIFVTPLTRRSYSNGKVVENLATQAQLTIQAATETQARYIDLNRASTDYCNAIGEDASHKYNLNPTDNTHLNVWGSVVFGRLVSDLLVNKYSGDFTPYTQPNATLSGLIGSGKPAK